MLFNEALTEGNGGAVGAIFGSTVPANVHWTQLSSSSPVFVAFRMVVVRVEGRKEGEKEKELLATVGHDEAR